MKASEFQWTGHLEMKDPPKFSEDQTASYFKLIGGEDDQEVAELVYIDCAAGGEPW